MFQEKILLGLILLLLFLFISRRRNDKPVLHVLNRWLNWIFMSTALGLLTIEFDFSDRPVWLLSLTYFLLWFLLESAYMWLGISMISKSPVPLFPKYKGCRSEGFWPNNQYFIKCRQTIRDLGFKPIHSMFSEIFGPVSIESTVFENDGQDIRLQVVFLPTSRNRLKACFVFTSILKDGTRVISDNINIPFAGYYPDNWSVSRRPLTDSVEKLYYFHEKRLAQTDSKPAILDDCPLMDINAQQTKVFQYNVDHGLLNPTHKIDEHGKITPDGRFRLWLEMWTLKYLGFSFAK